MSEPFELVATDVTVGPTAHPILDRVSLRASAGEWTTLTGPTGSGKSVLLQTLAGLMPMTSGAVSIGGQHLREWSAQNGPPAVVPQDYALLATLTAHETVGLPLQQRGVPVPEIRERVAAQLEALGLTASARQQVSRLSGGQRQRVAIARALAAESPVLLLDEPTAELDEANARHVVALLRARLAAGSVIVVCSHDPDILTVSDQTVRL